MKLNIQHYCRFQVTFQKYISMFVTNVRIYVLIVGSLGRVVWSMFASSEAKFASSEAMFAR